jgi:hypothetical protein
MSRLGTGQVIVREGKRGRTFALRYRVAGQPRQFETLGSEADGWTPAKAQEELENRRAAIRLGVWEPPADRREPARAPAVDEETFHIFASKWLAGREAEGLSPKTLVDLHWSIECHLLPFFADYPLTAITPQLVDEFKITKVRERRDLEERAATWQAAEPDKRGQRPPRGLSKSSINHCLRHLSSILEVACEYGLVSSNAASGRRTSAARRRKRESVRCICHMRSGSPSQCGGSTRCTPPLTTSWSARRRAGGTTRRTSDAMC